MGKRLLSLVVASFLVAGVFGCKDKKKETEDKPAAEAEDQKETEDKADEKAEADKEKEAEAEGEEAEDAGGQWVENEMYGLKFRVPEDWEVVTDEQGSSATSPDGAITVLLAGSESDELVQATINDLRADLEFDEVQLQKSKLTTINGIPGMEGTGTAVLKKESGPEEIQFLAYSLKADSKTATMMVFSEATMYEAKKEMVEGIANTIVKIK